MANLIIKPTSGGSLVLQDEGGDAALTVGTTGVSTIANATITSGTITAATFPAGHIIQTVSAAITVSSSTVTSYVDTALTKAITSVGLNSILSLFLQAKPIL